MAARAVLAKTLFLAPTLPSKPTQRRLASRIRSRASLSCAGSVQLRLWPLYLSAAPSKSRTESMSTNDPGCCFLSKKNAPGRLDRLAFCFAQIDTHRAPLVSDGELIGAIIGRTGKFLIEVLQVGNVFVTQGSEQFQLDHRGHDVVGRHYHVVERYPAALDFGEHAFRILV